MKKFLVIYHANCADGFAAALAAWLRLKDTAEYLAVNYSDAVPDVAGKVVYVLDFSYPPDVLAQMEAVAESVTLLDHHKTSADRFNGYVCRCHNKVLFDMDKSGARLAWEHFHLSAEVPTLIQLVEDRDLWRWQYPRTADYMAALHREERSFAAWHKVLVQTPHETEQFLQRGKAMRQEFDQLCISIAEKAYPIVVNGQAGLAVNAPSDFTSELGEILAKKSGTFGVVWSFQPTVGIKCGFRAVKPVDISPLALSFGGGGHPQAAACVLGVERAADLLRGKLDEAAKV